MYGRRRNWKRDAEGRIAPHLPPVIFQSIDIQRNQEVAVNDPPCRTATSTRLFALLASCIAQGHRRVVPDFDETARSLPIMTLKVLGATRVDADAEEGKRRIPILRLLGR